MEQELLKIHAALKSAALDVDGTHSDLVKYPGYTKRMAAQRLLRLAHDLEKTRQMILKLGDKENK